MRIRLDRVKAVKQFLRQGVLQIMCAPQQGHRPVTLAVRVLVRIIALVDCEVDAVLSTQVRDQHVAFCGHESGLAWRELTSTEP